MQHEMTELPRLAEVDGVFFLTLAKGDRLSIATTIERLIDMLDAMEPDPDLEPWLAHLGSDAEDREGDCGGYGGDADRGPSLGWTADGQIGEYARMANCWGELELDDEREIENEHGGDIQDEPHDEQDEGDAEPFLGWSECQSMRGAVASGDEFPRVGNGPMRFDGVGYLTANHLLRSKGLSGVRVSPALATVGSERLTIIAPGIARVGDW